MSPQPSRPASNGRPHIAMPAGRHFALTWSIPDDYGGMTGALLHRSRGFVRLGGTPVDVLTFDARVDYPQLADRMRAGGELIDGLRILNLWDWLREHPLAFAAPHDNDLDVHAFSPLDADDTAEAATRIGPDNLAHVLTRTRWDAERGSVLQVDYLRMDGSLLASDRRDCHTRGSVGGRSVVICDDAGRPVRSWNGPRPLYRSWLDRLRPSGATAYMIVDSKTVASFMLTYRRPEVVTVHVVHSSHLAGGERPHAPLRPTRREVFENLDKFDSVVVLTDRQKKDILDRDARLRVTVGSAPQPPKNLAVIPNSRDLGDIRPERGERPRGTGVVLASLTARKRVDHAITAMAEVSRALSGYGGTPPATARLDVYGDGILRADLERLAAREGVGGVVRFHGHDPAARSLLASTSFVLLTATSEGFPLVLVESMAAGCIPIAYDVPYGPADIIRDGHNGYLVEAGNVEALAEAVLTLLRAPQREIERMRAAARRTAKRYSDPRVTRLWARELASARRRKGGPHGVPKRAKAVLRRGKRAILRLRTAAR